MRTVSACIESEASDEPYREVPRVVFARCTGGDDDGGCARDVGNRARPAIRASVELDADDAGLLAEDILKVSRKRWSSVR